MTYVGRGIDAISNVEKLTNITFDGSTTYNLVKDGVAFTPAGKNNILISINGVIQQGNFTVANATIIFDFSPTSNDTCNFIMHYGTGVLNTPADDTVKTATVQDDAITTDKLANSINSAITANTAKTTNATHSGEVTGATALTIADNIVDEANLKVSNSAVNGYALTAQSGNTGGLTWAEMSSGGSWDLVYSDNVSGMGSGTNAYTASALFSSAYKMYRVYMFNCEPANDGVDYRVQLKLGGVLRTSDYAYHLGRDESNAATTNPSNNNSNSHYRIADGIGSGTSEKGDMWFQYYNPAVDDGYWNTLLSDYHGIETNNYSIGGRGFGHNRASTGAMSGFTISVHSGGLGNYNLRAYGFKQA